MEPFSRSTARTKHRSPEAVGPRNVTLRGPKAEAYFACPTCKRLCAVGLTKKGKPYFTCNECGVQVFFRGKEGIRRFQELVGQAELSGNVRGISPLLEYAALLRNRKREIQETIPILGTNPSLQVELQLVESELERIEIVCETELKASRKRLRELRQSNGE